MKKFFFSFVMLMLTSTMGIFAQSTLVATLSRNDSIISTFYGANALVNAHDAAQNGDVINLSSGNFSSTIIDNSITLRGMGMEMDSINNIQPTTLIGDLLLSASNIYVEGICHNGTLTLDCGNHTIDNVNFTRCRFRTINDNSGSYYNSYNINLTFTSCKITNDFTINNRYQNTVSFVNSYVANADMISSIIGSMYFINCIYEINLGKYSDLGSSLFQNCIILGKGKGNLSIYTDAYNCVAISENTLFDNVTSNTTNVVVDDYANLFKTYRGTYSDTETFELTDEAKATFLGDDGTQIGIYGGISPYNPIPEIPRILKFEVDRKSSSDGKLNVNVEVSATGK